MTLLPQQRQHRLRLRIRLRQHRLRRLLQDVVVRELHYLLRRAYVADTALGGLEVLDLNYFLILS